MISPFLTPEQKGALAVALNLEKQYKDAADESEALCSQRNAAVLHAINLNVRPALIAAHLGLSSSRIGQIKRRAA